MRAHVHHRESGGGDPPRGSVPKERLQAAFRQLTSSRIAGELAPDPDPGVIRRTWGVLKPWLVPYFRPEVRGLEHVPDEPSMLVGQHDGGYIPVDGICLGFAWYERFQFQRPLIWLMHDFPFRLSASFTTFLSQHGIHPASRDSVRRAFDQNRSLFVYPGGAHEAFRPYKQRRDVELGHRTGFIAEALSRRVPVVPVVSAGAHETLFVLSRGSWLARKLPIAKKLRSDVVPFWLGLPWGLGFGPLPHIPLPAKITVQVLPPVRLWEHLGDRADPTDPITLQTGLDIVRSRMQVALSKLYAERRWPILG